MSEANKAMVRRIAEGVNNTTGPMPQEWFAPDYVAHISGSSGPMDYEANKQMAGTFYMAFPDLRHIVEDQIAEGDKVVTRVTLRGTHKGDFQGIAPTGKQITMGAIVIQRISGGRIAEELINVDAMGLMHQLGVVPGPSSA